MNLTVDCQVFCVICFRKFVFGKLLNWIKIAGGVANIATIPRLPCFACVAGGWGVGVLGCWGVGEYLADRWELN